MSHTLLLADDSVTIQRVIELTFVDEDIQVIAVGDGQQAVDRIKADPPDIVLADTGMPERDGYDVSTFIKQDPALAHIPVVLLTGAFEPVDEERARQAGCDAVLVKPFEPQMVIDRVRDLLSQSATVPETSEPATVVADRDTETSEGPVHEPDEIATLPARSSGADQDPTPTPTEASARPVVPQDEDPLADYLDRMDEAFDRFEAATPDESTAAPGARSVEKPVPAVPSQPDDPPTIVTPPLALEASGSPSSLSSGSEAVIEPTSQTDVLRPVDASPSGEAEAAAVVPPPESAGPPSLPEPAMASAPEPALPSSLEAPETGAPPAEVAPPSAPVAAPPSLADAFASLLAAEQGDPARAPTVYPWPRSAGSPEVTEELIDRVAERVITRLSGGGTSELVARVVARVAEKLVREELERTKQR